MSKLLMRYAKRFKSGDPNAELNQFLSGRIMPDPGIDPYSDHHSVTNYLKFVH